MNRPAPWRILAVVLVFSLGFTIISARLVWVQLVNHEEYLERADRMHFVVVPVSPRRGSILDNNGHIMARTLTVTDLRIDGRLAHETDGELERIAAAIGHNPAEFRATVSPANRYLLLRQELTEAEQQALRELNCRSLIFEPRRNRVYPNAHEGSHVVGFTNRERRNIEGSSTPYEIEIGMDGMERVMDNYLRGVPGERRMARDARRREIAEFRQRDRAPRDGLNVVLTLDQGVQHAVENEADRLAREYRPDAVHIIVVRPATGEILGLANRPTYDPNDRTTMQPENLRNAALMDIYEPGSTFKVISLAGVLAERVADLDTPIFCENGEFVYANRLVRDTTAVGTVPLRKATAISSNIAFVKLALIMGNDKTYRNIRNFGFGELQQNPTQALRGEERGILRPPHYWSRLSPTSIPTGYEVAVTNLQMAMAVSAIANEGKLMEPRLVRRIQDDGGRTVKEFVPRIVRQAVPREVAAEVADALTAVVDEGTGRSARVPGFSVAGKTGTAIKLVNGAYSREGNYVASFIGFMPAEDPQFVVSVVVDNPRGGEQLHGGQVSGPAFRNIAIATAQQLNLVPQRAPRAIVAERPAP